MGEMEKDFIFNNKWVFIILILMMMTITGEFFWRMAKNENYYRVGQELDYCEDLIEEMIFGQGLWILFC